ncbi:hypothetical protein MRX96_027311 [Rhipicephalus microplus]
MQSIVLLRRCRRLMSPGSRRLLRTSPACLDADEDDTSELTKQRWDVVISGAGLAGAALACALGESHN